TEKKVDVTVGFNSHVRKLAVGCQIPDANASPAGVGQQSAIGADRAAPSAIVGDRPGIQPAFAALLNFPQLRKRTGAKPNVLIVRADLYRISRGWSHQKLLARKRIPQTSRVIPTCAQQQPIRMQKLDA